MEDHSVIKKVVLITACAVGFLPNVFAAHCSAKIINNSNQPWTFTFDSGTDKENIYFKNTSCPRNGPCTIGAKESVFIDYTMEMQNIGGAVYIKDYLGHVESSNYDNTDAEGDIMSCPGIDGFYDDAVRANIPDFGYFTINKESWSYYKSNEI